MLIAYDFPPVPSPQSLRWAYLVRELALLGHEMYVLTPDLPGYGAGGLPDIPATVSIHRVYPGPLSAWLRGRRRRGGKSEAATMPVAPAAAPMRGNRTFHELNWKGRVSYWVENGFSTRPSTLNWKGRLVERIKRMLSRVIFPDYRAEWLPWARRDLRALLTVANPDLVVTSHEPACSLPLGIEAKRLGYRWIADLGDPVLAAYTPRHWRRRARQLERDVCEQADLVCVTTKKTAELLEQRHGKPLARRLVLTQGFDAAFVDNDSLSAAVPFDDRRLELLYTGSFYAFRRADALIAAIMAVDGMRLSVATINAPDYLLAAAERYPEKFRLLGFLSHMVALSAQRRCDVLVNIANADPVQIPGKVYEYLGAGRPVIHLRGTAVDATSEMIDRVGGGWHMPPGSEGLIKLFEKLKVCKDSGSIKSEIDNRDRVGSHSWQQLARLFESEVSQLINPSDKSMKVCEFSREQCSD